MSIKTLLLVDDNPDIIRLLEVNLKNAGYKVISAQDGEKAFVLAKQFVPDLIILDIMLPGMDGYAVCQNLKSNKNTNLIPVLIISAKDRPIDKIIALKTGASEYITKPFDIQELIVRVDSLLKHTEENLSTNPLTKLPGNTSIINELNKRLHNKDDFAFIYIDLNNFKSYNDKYGFHKGDEIIRFTADTIKQSAAENDFIGHVGGDDFVFICEIFNAENACIKIADIFDNNIVNFYSKEDAQKGSIISKDRQGNTTEFPLMRLSMGIAKNDNAKIIHYNEIIELASEIKNHIKSQKIAGKSIFMSDKRKPEGTEKMKKKILIAEDDLNLQKLLKVNLESRGFDVVAVDDGEKALVEFYNILPDLFITDVMLPKIWGLDVCRGIRKSGQFKDIPILIMSGVYNKLEFRIDAQQAGATDMITKPFEIEDFTKYVEKLIAQTKPSSASAASSVKTTMPSDLTKNYSVDKKVVVYYPDGKIIKGITAAMNPGGTGFNMTLKDENKRAYIAYAQVSRVEVVDKF
ncbi:MAG: hypothetical protein A2252_03790 [Elusimicrobia bacterium RIFOXYA2_FULL_39_19]|nr:MAG: hypothetical protein A2252_03790 [Elusimicrobia bacterium RIFOXYA2_FULL_39_19]